MSEGDTPEYVPSPESDIKTVNEASELVFNKPSRLNFNLTEQYCRFLFTVPNVATHWPEGLHANKLPNKRPEVEE
jgi:hypothetical protein